MNRAKLMKSRNIGAVLALVLFIVVVMIVIGGGLLTLGANARIYAIRTEADTSAHCAADSGLTKTLWKINDMWAKKIFFSSPLPYETDVALANSEPPATFSYRIGPYYNVFAIITNPSGGTVPVANRYVVESIGRCGAAERTVYALLRLQGAGDTGILVKDFAILKSGTVVDGRDSRLAPNDPGQFIIPAQMGTSSTADDKVVLNNGVYVNGDVLVGYLGDPDTGIKDLGATVTGYEGSLDNEPEFPNVTAPALPIYKNPITVKGKDETFTPANSGTYPCIDLQQQATVSARLVISGGKVVLNLTGNNQGTSIDLGQGCEIVIMPDASLELYVGGAIKSGEDSGFNNQGKPTQLKLWGTANTGKGEPYQDWQLNAKSEYFGQVYAPNASIQINAKGDLYGAFTAYSFEMKSGGNIYYDAALRQVDINDQVARFVLLRWRED
jgi:hypothetical protein